MTHQQLRELGMHLIDAFNRGEHDRFRSLLAHDVVYDEVGTGRSMQGADAWLDAWEGWRRSFPDVRGIVTNSVVSGHSLIQEITWEGTHFGALRLADRSVPPSGRRQVTRAMQLLIVRSRKIQECRHYFDLYGLLEQIGAFESHMATAAS